MKAIDIALMVLTWEAGHGGESNRFEKSGQPVGRFHLLAEDENIGSRKRERGESTADYGFLTRISRIKGCVLCEVGSAYQMGGGMILVILKNSRKTTFALFGIA
jgi:hypothetical protein